MHKKLLAHLALIMLIFMTEARDARGGTITILGEELYMELYLSMVFPADYNIVPWSFNQTIHSKGIVHQKLYGENYPGHPTGAENSSWLYGYGEISTIENGWQAKAYIKQHDEPNPAVNDGRALASLEIEFVVQGNDINYDSLGWQEPWIFDLTLNEFLDWEKPYALRLLSDGHRYKTGMSSEVYGFSSQGQEAFQYSEIQFNNAEIVYEVAEPTTMLLMAFGLSGIVATYRKRNCLAPEHSDI